MRSASDARPRRHKRTPPRSRSLASAAQEEALFSRVVDIIDAARVHVSRSVNSGMAHAYWLIGREIVEVEQHGQRRAGYGDEVIERLATRLARSARRGFGVRTLRRIRLFYVTYPDGSAVPPELGGPSIRTAALSKSKTAKIRTAVLSKLLATPARFPMNLGWAHYLALMRVANTTARAFYEIEAVRESWSSRELERQIASLRPAFRVAREGPVSPATREVGRRTPPATAGMSRKLPVQRVAIDPALCVEPV